MIPGFKRQMDSIYQPSKDAIENNSHPSEDNLYLDIMKVFDKGEKGVFSEKCFQQFVEMMGVTPVRVPWGTKWWKEYIPASGDSCDVFSEDDPIAILTPTVNEITFQCLVFKKGVRLYYGVSAHTMRVYYWIEPYEHV